MTKVKCPSCARTVRAYQPSGGDGSALHTFRHKTNGRQCRGGLVTLGFTEDEKLRARAAEGSSVAFRELEQRKLMADAKKPPAPRYPEHEKLRAVAAESQACGEFLEWLRQRYTLAEYHVHSADCVSPKDTSTYYCGMSGGTLYPSVVDVQHLLAKFFEIDTAKIEEEKRAMLKKET